MKRLLSVLLFAVVSVAAVAQMPRTQVSYQTVGASVNTVFKLGGSFGIQPLFTPSQITDDGSNFTYNGTGIFNVPVLANINELTVSSTGVFGQASAHNQSVIGGCLTTNVGNAYTCSTTPSFTPVTGDQILVYFNAANTGASTLAVNSAAAAAIYKWGNTSALVSGDIQAAHYIRATWDGTHWQLEGQLGNAIATSTLGVSTNTAAAATYVGQVIQSQVVAGSAVSLTNNTAAVVTSVSLTAGDWDVEASGNFLGTSITTAATGGFELSINSGTGCSTPAQATTGQEVWTLPPALTTTSANFGAAVSQQQALIGSTTTYCLVATGTFSAGTLKADGTLVARRRH